MSKIGAFVIQMKTIFEHKIILHRSPSNISFQVAFIVVLCTFISGPLTHGSE